MPHLANAGRFSSASYGETVSYVANSMGLSEPDIKVVKVISWLFNVPVGEVKSDLKTLWASQRKAEQNDRDPTGGRSIKR